MRTFLLGCLREDGSRQENHPTHITHYDQIITTTKPKHLQKASETKGAVELKQILKRLR